jgi:uncharacterized glyoxalase superfamily protein PhnB
MTEVAKSTRSTIIPALRYRDVDRALELLTRVFGFTDAGIYRDDAGKVVHAQLAFGNGMVMLGPVSTETAFGRMMAEPEAAGGVTATIYAIVADPDAHHARAVAAGLEIVMPLRDESYGGREYSVRDMDGHVWTFGTYDPWPAA